MSYSQIPDNLLEKVSADVVVRHALRSGWQEIADPKGELAILRRHDEEFFLTRKREFKDYFDRIKDAIRLLCQLEGKTPAQLLEELLLPRSDLFKFSIADNTTDSGTVILDDALSLLKGAKVALTAAACSVIKPQKLHPRLRRTDAEAFIATCRMAQTELGSFVTTIICPIEPLPFEEWDQQTKLFDHPETFGRKVTTTFMEAVYSLEQTISKREIENEILTAPENSGISWNLCDALTQMQPHGRDSVLGIRAVWEPSSVPKDVASIVQLKKEYFPIIEQIGLELKPKKPPEQTAVFVGKVDELKGEEGAGGMQGEVHCLIFENDETIRARLDLKPEDYQIACNAHRDSSLVAIVGDLHRHGRLQQIKNYQHFNILPVTKMPDDPAAYDDD